MPDDKLLEWYKEQLGKGLSRDDIIQILYELGYSEDEISDLISTAEGIQPASKAPQRKTSSEVHPPEVIEAPVGKPIKPSPRKQTHKTITKRTELPKRPTKPSVELTSEPLSEVISREFSFIWKLILIAILLVLIITGIGLVILFNIQSAGDGFPFLPLQRVDDVPPKVSISVPQTEWLGAGSTFINCSDSGIDFSSGCNNSSYAYFVSSAPSCPEDPSAYSSSITGYKAGYLCVLAKDNDGNIGISEPVYVKFDIVKPTTSIQASSAWFKSSFKANITDSDNESGLNTCFYRVKSSGKTILDWTSRACNSSASIPVGLDGCDTDGSTCTVEVYALDNAGNKGDVKSTTFNIDLTPPSASITSVTPSTIDGATITVSDTIEVKGSVSDAHFKKYTLEIRGDSGSDIIAISSAPVSSNTLGSYDTRKSSDGHYQLVLTAEDIAGNAKSVELGIEINNRGAPCNSGETQTCSWLKGVCASSTRTCGSSGSWGNCNVQAVSGYEPLESACNDTLDNDCDGLSDCDDTDCMSNPNCNTTNGTSVTLNCSGDRLVGDVNGDGVVSLYDASAVGRIANGIWNFTGSKCCVDVNSDGQITLEDSELIANYTLGRTNCFPAGYSCSARENCNNGKDDDCDGLVDCQQDKEDPDCNCGSSISCVGGNQLVGDMNNDGVIDIVDASFIGQIANGTREFIGSEICCADVNNDGQITMEDAEIVVNYTVGNINCFERGYSCSARENCDNNKDDDCDGLNNCDDPDCSGSPACGGTCTSDGGICTQDSDCCSGKCDSETGKCFSCASCSGINKCSNQETDECEAQCGASSACDDIHVDSYWIDNQYCKSCKDCSYTGDRTVGSCGCSTSNCKNGYCQTGTTCYYGVSCTLNGWSYSNSCSTADSCGTNTLVTGKTCGAGGCSAGTTYTCSSSSHTNCQSKSCGGKTYYCTYDGSSWAWRTSKPEESTAAGNCGDGVDNDCNTFIDCNSENEDPGCDCGGTPHYVCFDSSIYEIKYYPNTDDYMWYGDTAFGLVGIQSTTTIIRDFVRWDISSIPDNAVILSVAFKYHCTSGVTTQWGEIYEMQYDPMAHIGESQLIYTDCGDGTMYVGGRNVFPEEGEQKEISLGSDAVSKLQSNLQSDWFAIGLKVEDEASGTPDLYEIIGKTASSNPPPALCIVYTP